MQRTFGVWIPFAIVVALALVWSCSDSSSPTSFDTPVNNEKAQGNTTGLSTSKGGWADTDIPNPHEEFNCTNVQEVYVRFSDPGFVEENLVGLYVNYVGMPEGRKRLRIWWDYENEPTLWNDTEIGDGTDYEGVIEHAYQGITEETTFQVRAEVILVGKTGNCARNRDVTVTPGQRTTAATRRTPGVYPIAFAPEPAGGTRILVCDDCTTDVPLGFNFVFFGNTYSTVRVSSNGFLSFNPVGSGCCSGRTIPSGDGYENIIAFNWLDLHPGAGGLVEYSTRGAAPSRRFVVTFTGVPTYSGGGTVTTQVILHEGTNHIEVHTTTQNAATYQVTQGVEDATGSVAYFLAGRVATNYHLNNDAVLFVTN